MGFIARQAKTIKNMSIGDLDAMMDSTWGRPTSAGVPVSEQISLGLIEVQKCSRVRSETRGCLETKVFKWTDTAHRKKEEARDHSLNELLTVAPNDETDAQSYTEAEELSLSLWGNHGAIITRNTSRNRNITELYQLEWWKVRVRRDKETQKLIYEYWDRGKLEPIPNERMFHENLMSWDGVNGLSIIGMARESIAQGLAMQEFSNRFFGSGMNVGSVIEAPPGAITDKTRPNIKEAIKEMNQGLGNSWEPLLLEEGLKWTRIPMSFVDAQFVDMMKLNKIDIDGLFRVPPPMVGSSYEGLTYSNVEQLSLNYVLYSLLPSVTRFERMANWKLLTKQEREAGYFVKTNINTLLRADAKTRSEYFKNKVQNMAMSPNDWRLADDENPLDSEAGDQYFGNGNLRTIDQIVVNDIGVKNSNSQNGGGSDAE